MDDLYAGQEARYEAILPKPQKKAAEYKPMAIAGYRISSEGKVAITRIRKTYINKAGYQALNVRVEGRVRTYLLHRLVAEAFVPNPKALKRIRFKDGDKLNCAADNLEWA